MNSRKCSMLLLVAVRPTPVAAAVFTTSQRQGHGHSSTAYTIRRARIIAAHGERGREQANARASVMAQTRTRHTATLNAESADLNFYPPQESWFWSSGCFSFMLRSCLYSPVLRQQRQFQRSANSGVRTGSCTATLTHAAAGEYYRHRAAINRLSMDKRRVLQEVVGCHSTGTGSGKRSWISSGRSTGSVRHGDQSARPYQRMLRDPGVCMLVSSSAARLWTRSTCSHEYRFPTDSVEMKVAAATWSGTVTPEQS